MTLLYIDGFDHYTNLTGAGNRLYELSPNLWVKTDPGGHEENTHGVCATMPELGGLGLQMWINTEGATISGDPSTGVSLVAPATWTTGSTFGIGFHFYTEALSIDSNSGGIIGFGDLNNVNISLKIATSGEVQLWSGDIGEGSLIENTGVFITPSTLYHIEFQMFINSTTGTAELRLNGQSVWSTSNINTLGDGTFGNIYFAPANMDFGSNEGDRNSSKVYFDNLYIYDTAGTVNNDWMGERNIYTLFPDADGVTQEWTLTSGTDAWAILDTFPPDPLVTYAEATVDGQDCLVSLEAPPSSDIVIAGIQVTPLSYKTGTTNTDLETGIVINSVEDTGIFSLVQDQPGYQARVIELNPDTLVEFTPTDLGNLEVILRRTDSA